MDAVCCALLPADCRLCGKPLPSLSRAPVCAPCLDSPRPQAESLPGALCRVCGESLGMSGYSLEAPDLLCPACRMVPPPFVRAAAYGLYEDSLRGLIHLFKYERVQALDRRLGALAAAAMAALDLPASVTVVPVPLHAAKARARGFNQAAALARAAMAELRRSRGNAGVALTLEPDALVRVRDTESQASLSPRQRRANLRGAFAAPRPGRLRGRTVLLVDDIYTTGATARAAGRVLLEQAGAEAVYVATLARAQREAAVRWQPPPGEDGPARSRPAG